MGDSDTSISVPQEQATKEADGSSPSARYGMALFGLYLLFYCGFMGLNVLAPHWMAATVAGVNLAILYGFGLIVAALVLASIYLHLCGAGKPEGKGDGR